MSNWSKSGTAPGHARHANTFAREIREAIIAAPSRIGSDGKGKDGLVGYFTWLAGAHPRIFIGLLLEVMRLDDSETDKAQENRMAPGSTRKILLERLGCMEEEANSGPRVQQ
jgi:hypothetical protein